MTSLSFWSDQFTIKQSPHSLFKDAHPNWLITHSLPRARSTCFTQKHSNYKYKKFRFDHFNCGFDCFDIKINTSIKKRSHDIWIGYIVYFENTKEKINQNSMSNKCLLKQENSLARFWLAEKCDVLFAFTFKLFSIVISTKTCYCLLPANGHWVFLCFCTETQRNPIDFFFSLRKWLSNNGASRARLNIY